LGLGAGSFTNDNLKKVTDDIDTEQGWVVISADQTPRLCRDGSLTTVGVFSYTLSLIFHVLESIRK